MNEEEIRYCINIATLGKELPYKKLLKAMKKEHLVDVCYELLKEHLALLDIKEMIDNPCTKKDIYFDDGDVLIAVENIVNKALGDKNE